MTNLKYFFSSNFKLKERKRKTEKEILPPNPLLKEKEKKEKEEKTREIAGREISVPFSDLDVRRNAFRQEVWARRDKYEVIIVCFSTQRTQRTQSFLIEIE